MEVGGRLTNKHHRGCIGGRSRLKWRPHKKCLLSGIVFSAVTVNAFHTHTKKSSSWENCAPISTGSYTKILSEGLSEGVDIFSILYVVEHIPFSQGHDNVPLFCPLPQSQTHVSPLFPALLTEPLDLCGQTSNSVTPPNVAVSITDSKSSSSARKATKMNVGAARKK